MQVDLLAGKIITSKDFMEANMLLFRNQKYF